MTPVSRGRRLLAWSVMVLALGVYALGAAGLAAGWEPFFTWRYCFTWWPYILVVESILALNDGPSDLYDAPADFLLLLPLSVTLWLGFEAYNFVLDNWSYSGVPRALGWRWLGYTAGYATVLPGIFSTARLLDFLGLCKDSCKVQPLKNPAGLYLPLAATGILFACLPLALPRLFFPLPWLAFIFLLEPLNHARGGRSLLGSWEEGDLRPLWLLLTAGLVCGLLWEFWNYNAGAKWLYHLPFLNQPKLFEMPLAGFLGFPFFAVECWVLANGFFALKRRAEGWRRTWRIVFWTTLAVGAAALDLAIMAGVDRWTVVGRVIGPLGGAGG